MSTPRTPLAMSDPGRRPHDVSSGARRTDRHARDDDDVKRLIVGRDISLSGEITACDVLVVEGSVQATLSNSAAIEIAESGTFKGEAEIDRADISGVYDGTITVRARLTVRSSGRVIGTIRYGEIEIEAGGIISGDVQMMVPEPPKVAEADKPADVKPRPVAGTPASAAAGAPSGAASGAGAPPNAASGSGPSGPSGSLVGRPPEKTGDLVEAAGKP